MKCTSLGVLAICIHVVGVPAAALAQDAHPAAVARRDIVGIVAWQNVNKSNLSGEYFGDWIHRGAYGGCAVGWYWTDHHKIEIEAGATNRAEFWRYETYQIDNLTAFGSARHTFSARRVAIAEQYQFFRNSWFHPHVAAGADLEWETSTERSDAVFTSSSSGQPRLIRPAQVVGPETRLRVRPFGEAGFKSYITPRAFFRTDLRLLLRERVDEVQLRFGLGIDF